MIWWLIVFGITFVITLWLVRSGQKDLDKQTASDLKLNLELEIIGSIKNFDKELAKLPRVDIAINPLAQPLAPIAFFADYTTRNITKETPHHKLSDVVVISVITIELQNHQKNIVEFSAIKMVDFDIVDCMTTLINPNATIPPEVTAECGITNDMVKNAPEFYQVADSIREYIGGSAIVGYNLAYDIKYLCAHGLDLIQNKPSYCIVDLAKRYIKNLPNYKLDTIYGYLGMFRDMSQRRALSNCFATLMAYIQLLKTIFGDEIGE